MSSRTAAARGLTAAALLSCALLSACSSNTGGTAVGPTEATAFVTLTTSTPTSAEATSSSQPTTEPTSGPAQPTETATESKKSEPAPDSPTTSNSPTSKTTTKKPSATLGPSTGSDDKPVVAYWLGDPPADPDTAGPEGGPTCKADSQYVNEPTTGLQPEVVKAWNAAVAAAKRAGITLCLNDGKRSRAQQLAQFADYEKQYGKDVAEQLVLPPDRSAHVLGVAVDAQPAAGWQWLQQTKGSLGFCRRYDNEGWHFEYDPQFRTAGCPERLPQPVG